MDLAIAGIVGDGGISVGETYDRILLGKGTTRHEGEARFIRNLGDLV